MIEIKGLALQHLVDSIKHMQKSHRGIYIIRVSESETTVKFKINEGMWSPPYPKSE